MKFCYWIGIGFEHWDGRSEHKNISTDHKNDVFDHEIGTDFDHENC